MLILFSLYKILMKLRTKLKKSNDFIGSPLENSGKPSLLYIHFTQYLDKL
jgi:hypothetical protein